jgi:hypothetical protein
MKDRIFMTVTKTEGIHPGRKLKALYDEHGTLYIVYACTEKGKKKHFIVLNNVHTYVTCVHRDIATVWINKQVKPDQVIARAILC